MLGAFSRVRGVQSYSDSSKKSSNLEVMTALMRDVAVANTLENAEEAVIRVLPPRCADLEVQLGELYRQDDRM